MNEPSEKAPHHADKSNPFIAAVLAAGSTQEDAALHYLWPCNVLAWSCWGDLQTQWRTGMSGATGLDYAGVRAYLDECGYCADERKDIFIGIRAAEGATLQAWSEKAKQEAAQRTP